jgi:hypothetical protein
MTPVGEHPFGSGQTVRQGCGSGVVADLACGHEELLRTTLGVRDGVQPGVQSLSPLGISPTMGSARRGVEGSIRQNSVRAGIAIGKAEGARLVAGGARVRRDSPGHFLQPALFAEATNQMRIAREEIFGPVAAVIRVRDYDEALALANDTPFGLSSGICTTSLKHATHFKRNAEAGMVMVNLPTAGVDFHVPFGGRKASSHGPREQGRYAAEFYTTVKTAYTLA